MPSKLIPMKPITSPRESTLAAVAKVQNRQLQNFNHPLLDTPLVQPKRALYRRIFPMDGIAGNHWPLNSVSTRSSLHLLPAKQCVDEQVFPPPNIISLAPLIALTN